MLSYQHIFHAGNLADVQKHALLCSMLAYMTDKSKPLSYMETHAGRGLYFLDADEAVKTGEAAKGIGAVSDWFPADHPYARALDQIRAEHGAAAYPGSPLLARTLLRDTDPMHLAELHPQEHAALDHVLGHAARVHRRDGYELANALCPSDPRRGVLLIDPSYEIKTDYTRIPTLIGKLHRKWNVGVIALWYPVLSAGAQDPMIRALEALELPKVLHHVVHFPKAREGHRMIGSGMFIVNAPYGLSDEAARLSGLFNSL